MRQLILTGLMMGSLIAPLRLIAAEVVDRVVAIVGDEIITLSDVKHYSSERSFEAKLARTETKDPLEALIREKVLKQEMERLGITTSDEDINNAIQEVLMRNKITLQILKNELIKKGTPFEKYKKELGDQIRQMKFMGQVIFPRIKISDEEVAAKTGGDSSESARLKARMQILESRSPAEVSKYLDEVRTKTYVEIKKP